MGLLDINFEADKKEAFHSSGIAREVYGTKIGAASPVAGAGRAGEGDIGAVGTYRDADVIHRPKRDPAQKKLASDDKTNSRDKLQVKERDGDKKNAAFSHREPSEPTIRTFREPPGRSYNPYG